MKYQVYSLQQSLRATNARVDQLEKELARLRRELSNGSGSSTQHPVSYTGNSQPDRPTPSIQTRSAFE